LYFATCRLDGPDKVESDEAFVLGDKDTPGLQGCGRALHGFFKFQWIAGALPDAIGGNASGVPEFGT